MDGTQNQQVGMAVGGVYALFGIAGFFVTGDVGFAGTEGTKLILFDVNGLHNIVHLLIGVALFFAARSSADSSRTMNTLVGSVYAIVGLVGFFVLDSSLNILALNQADNFLHIGTAAILLWVGLSKGTTTT